MSGCAHALNVQVQIAGGAKAEPLRQLAAELEPGDMPVRSCADPRCQGFAPALGPALPMGSMIPALLR